MASNATGVQLLPVYDVIVVGAGLFGSSAARHAANMTEDGRRLSVCLIGPEEPKVREGHTIFGSHYDESRLARCMQGGTQWSTLAVQSIKRYRSLEQESGIKFFGEAGCLTIGNPAGGWVFDVEYPCLKICGQTDYEQLNNDDLRQRFPYLGLPTPDQKWQWQSVGGILETANAGWINPRRLCAAQHAAAVKAGCHVVRDVVSDVCEQTDDQSGSRLTTVTTDGGLKLQGKKVLIATGAFTEFRHLLPSGTRLDVQPSTEVVAFVELKADDVTRLSEMPGLFIACPALFYDEPPAINEEDKFECYVLPPIKYPDGKTYLKIGLGHHYRMELKTQEEIINWYQKPVPEHMQTGFKDALSKLFPDLVPVSIRFEGCADGFTPPLHRPIVDLLTDSLGVALGGNGVAAKSSDEIGRIAAELLVTGTWSHDLPRDQFRAGRRS